MTRQHAKRRSSARQPFATSLLCPPMARSSTPETSPRLEQTMLEQSTFWPEEHLASLFPSPVSERDWMTRVATSPSSLLDLLADSGPYGWCGRTSPACCRSTTDGRLEPSSGCWSNSGMGSPTEFFTLNISEYPSDGAASSLSDVLETGELPQRYYLSATACRGILRRAEKRGKSMLYPQCCSICSVTMAMRRRILVRERHLQYIVLGVIVHSARRPECRFSKPRG